MNAEKPIKERYRLLLIQPFKKWNRWISFRKYYVPYNLALIQSLTPSKYAVTIINSSKSDKIIECDLVGITTTTTWSKEAYAIADKYRANGIKVVIGGIHVSTLPQEAALHSDSVAIGEVDLIWNNILQDFEKNSLKRYYYGKTKDTIEIPILNKNRTKFSFLPNLIQTTRGCPYNCSFCTVNKVSGKKIRHRPIKDIIEEIKNIKGPYNKNIIFLDDNIVADKEYASELFKELIPQKKKWFSQTSVEIAKDRKLLELAYKSGCRFVLIGFESISQNTLEYFNKKVNREREYSKIIRTLKKYNIIILGSFVFSYNETIKDIERTFSFIKNNGIDFISVTPLIPYPGTTVFEETQKEGLILTNDWSKFNFNNLIIRTETDPKAYVETINKEYQQFYSWRYLIKVILKLIKERRIKYIFIFVGLFIYLKTRFRLKLV